jgi:hypothetical protein
MQFCKSYYVSAEQIYYSTKQNLQETEHYDPFWGGSADINFIQEHAWPGSVHGLYSYCTLKNKWLV